MSLSDSSARILSFVDPSLLDPLLSFEPLLFELLLLFEPLLSDPLLLSESASEI